MLKPFMLHCLPDVLCGDASWVMNMTHNDLLFTVARKNTNYLSQLEPKKSDLYEKCEGIVFALFH